ncbi:DUF6512 family protein [Faecalicatena contorta]|uniref:DUF6512 family protein n=1 Tax=Faecalicatena contorta TaxID=39482 RepID=UPI001F1C99E1|nr:DUF6512 family protein [Faecalicatena contorta]MCF2555722.1 hypothetical protein [Faecalicatena contorta]
MKNKWDFLLPKKDRPAFLAIGIMGTLNHFLYEWTGIALVALFCPINESVWEHLKLLFFPYLFWSVWKYLCKKTEGSTFFYSHFWAVVCGMTSIVVLFYTYTGMIGRSFVFIDILIFFVSIVITLRFTRRWERARKEVPAVQTIYTMWIALILTFFVFTCFPPGIPLFFSP